LLFEINYGLSIHVRLSNIGTVLVLYQCLGDLECNIRYLLANLATGSQVY